MKYKLQASEKPNYWVCTDIDNGIVCVFENQNFNENQNFTILEDIEKPNATELAKLVNQMGGWLRNNHYCKILPCNISQRIGNRIAELRLEKGLTQEELAELVGMKQSNLSRIETGVHGAGLDMLGRMEKALDCKLDFIEPPKQQER